MCPTIRSIKKHEKARQCRRRTAQERLARDRRQAQHAATVLEQALHDLGLSDNAGPVRDRRDRRAQEPKEALMCLETAISGPRLIRA